MTDLQLIFAAVVGTLAVARMTRLLVDDDWPPVWWLRDRWSMFWAKRAEAHNDDEDKTKFRNTIRWMEGLSCAFCVSIWFGFVGTLLTWLSFNGDGKLDWWWWLPALWLAGSYVAAMITVRDLPEDQRAAPDGE